MMILNAFETSRYVSKITRKVNVAIACFWNI